ATIQASSDGILVVDRNSRFVTYNQKFVDVMRVPEEILLAGDANRSLQFSLTQVKDPIAFRAAIQSVREASQVSATFEMLDGRVIEFDGAPRRVDGEVIGRVWSFRDVTASVRAEAALRQSEQKYRAVVANIPDVIWTANAAGRLSFISPNIEAMC